ncbi:MAG TPA: flagellar export chaperone FliS [Chloroflexota bacterium]|nr:flagellar export chaperone FliS [Chloroflexota bacterium]
MAYAQVGIETGVHGASPHQLVQMLFDGLLESLAQARGAIVAGDLPARGRALRRAIAIVDEGLRGALDLERGGELAGNLQELYGYVVMRLTQAHATSDPALLDECQRLIQPLREAWNAIKPQRLAA